MSSNFLLSPGITKNSSIFLLGNLHAGLIREVWYDIPGYSINDLTSNPNFPSRPSSVEVLDKFDAPFNVDDNYGSRISGYFHAPETGDYRWGGLHFSRFQLGYSSRNEKAIGLWTKNEKNFPKTFIFFSFLDPNSFISTHSPISISFIFVFKKYQTSNGHSY